MLKRIVHQFEIKGTVRESLFIYIFALNCLTRCLHINVAKKKLNNNVNCVEFTITLILRLFDQHFRDQHTEFSALVDPSKVEKVIEYCPLCITGTQVCRFSNCKLAVQSKLGPQRFAQIGYSNDSGSV